VETGEPLIKQTFFYSDDYAGQRVSRSFDIRAARLGDGFVAVWRDVTETRRAAEVLRESEARYRTLLDASPGFVWHADATGGLLYVSENFHEYAGTSQQRFQGALWKMREVIHPEDLPLREERWRHSVETGEPYDVEIRLRGADGVYRWFLNRALPIRQADGSISGWVGTSTNIDDRKRLEEKLREADRRKDEFLAMLAHELRNPLAAVRSATEVLRRVDAPGSQLPAMRAVIERQTNQLVRMVDDLLDVSRISQGKLFLRKEKIDLSAVVERAVETSQPLIEAGRHRLRVQLPAESPRLDGDLQRLAQAVSNLLNNAAKYTETGGNIQLTVETAGDEALLRVKDDGIGIAAEILPNIFDLFAQADRALHRAQGGLGIGLTLVKNIVEMHGGRAEAFSAGPGQGSEVVLHLPLAEVAHPAGAPGPASGLAPAPPSGHRVLVVDDNIDSAESLAMLLEIAGHEVRAAHDGGGAVEVARDFQPRFVLLDIGLPGMDGFEVARRLRQESEMRQAVLVALTGYGQDEDRRKSLEAGFDHHLTKPVDFAVLKNLIDSLSPA
jgi:two-component system CheB/CheR fusion protein